MTHVTIAQLKGLARRFRAFHYLHVLRRTGVRHLVRRERIVRGVDRAKPRHTQPWRPWATDSAVELHMLVHQPDVRVALWSLHSFYAASNVDWPIVLHQGGRMDGGDWDTLRSHFPNAYTLTAAEADSIVEKELRHRGMNDAADIRRRSPTFHKLTDPSLVSSANTLFMLDTDVLFFRRPTELLEIAGRADHLNTYNRDPLAYPYNISAETVEREFNMRLVEGVNTGLALINRETVRFDRIKQYLTERSVLASLHFAEQTILALLASEFGCSMLPDTYCCSKSRGLTTANGEPLVAKHYIETPRPLLFEEGMPEVNRQGVVRSAP